MAPLLFLVTSALADPMGPWMADDPRAQELPYQPRFYLVDSELAPCEDYALVEGLQMLEDPDLYTLFDPERSWGTAYLVELLEASALHVAMVMPDADPLFIGDLSYRNGGPMYGHRKHQGGRDADIGLFFGDGEQAFAGFAEIDVYDLDLEANWLLIKTLVDSERIESILLDQRHIDDLRSWLSENQILPEHEIDEIFPPEGTDRLWSLRGIVRHMPRHHDHLHVRVRCD